MVMHTKTTLELKHNMGSIQLSVGALESITTMQQGHRIQINDKSSSFSIIYRNNCHQWRV